MATATKSKITIRPLDDRIVLKPNEAETKTQSGIFLPEGAQEKPLIGKVIAVGPGKLTDDGNRAPLGIKKGDSVVYGKYAGTEVDIDKQQYLIIRESELLGVVED